MVDRGSPRVRGCRGASGGDQLGEGGGAHGIPLQRAPRHGGVRARAQDRAAVHQGGARGRGHGEAGGHQHDGHPRALLLHGHSPAPGQLRAQPPHRLPVRAVEGDVPEVLRGLLLRCRRLLPRAGERVRQGPEDG